MESLSLCGGLSYVNILDDGITARSLSPFRPCWCVPATYNECYLVGEKHQQWQENK